MPAAEVVGESVVAPADVDGAPGKVVGAVETAVDGAALVDGAAPVGTEAPHAPSTDAPTAIVQTRSGTRVGSRTILGCRVERMTLIEAHDGTRSAASGTPNLGVR